MIDTTLIRKENILATSPNGLIANPTSIDLDGDVWRYRFGQLPKVGTWTVSLAEDLFGLKANHILGSISVNQGVLLDVSIPWSLNPPQLDQNTDEIATINTKLSDLNAVDVKLQEAIDTTKTDLTAELAKVKTTSEAAAKQSDLETAIKAYKDADTGLTGRLDGLATDLTDVKATADDAATKTAFQGLSDTVDQQTVVIGNVKKTAEAAAKATDLKTLETAVSENVVAINDELKLKAKQADLTAAISTLETADTALTDSLDDLKADLESVKSTADDAATSATVQALSLLVDDHKVQITNVKKTADAAASQVDLDALEEAVSENIAAIDTELQLKAKQTDLDKTNAAISGLYHESPDPPQFDLLAWRFWHQTSVAGSDRRSRLYYRIVGSNDAILMHDTTYSVLASEQDAIRLDDGRLEVTLHDGTRILYNNGRSGDLINFGFTAGVFSAIEVTYLDSSNGEIRTGYRLETITNTTVSHAIGRQDAPANAIAVRIRLNKPSREFIEYRFNLV